MDFLGLAEVDEGSDHDLLVRMIGDVLTGDTDVVKSRILSVCPKIKLNAADFAAGPALILWEQSLQAGRINVGRRYVGGGSVLIRGVMVINFRDEFGRIENFGTRGERTRKQCRQIGRAACR